ncbi:iron chelate uptake ABC transporter family permease subunit [Pacificibacter sp. AS14]|uniref:iron chelate uptake ABC transporter family permease subunit n=1 Tax=Pacificibacter sp. AS14 TaxID=3135785 RepID=UPI003174FA4B
MFDKRLIVLFICLALASGVFLTWGLTGRIWFILELRSVKLVALISVGISIGLATVLFQTLSGNRILTPSIMGFDALFLLVQTSFVFSLGGVGYAGLSDLTLFAANTLVMVVAAVALFGMILRRSRKDIHLMILVGVVFGLMFRAISAFLQRMINPSEFSYIQGAMFAQFSAINGIELIASVVVLVMIGIWLARHCAVLDVVALGRDTARGLGINYDRFQFTTLCVIAALVSVSTALVGPITFLGLLVSTLAHSLMKSHRHALILPAAALISALVLVVGQTYFERIMRLQSTLSVAIEFGGGLLFLILLARGKTL